MRGRLFVGLALLAATGALPAHAYPLAFPARGDSLPNGVYFESDGHTGENYYGISGWALDITAMEYIGSNWYVYEDQTPKELATNEQAYIFGADLFAPEDGEIVACWRSAPDKPNPSSNYDFDGDGDDDDSPMNAGNHLQIRNAAGDHIIYLAHLEHDSIPPELCPLPASRDADGDGWPDDTSNHCDIEGLEGFPAGTVLPTPIPIRKGDPIGRVGHSGASTGPHLHLHVKPMVEDGQQDMCMDDSVEIEFGETWAQTCEPGQDVTTFGWDILYTDNPIVPLTSPDHARYCFLPDAIGPQQDHHDFGVHASDLHFTTHSLGDVLVYRSSGDLRLRSYELEPNGSITDQSTLNQGGVLDLGVSRPRSSSRNVVVSIRGSNGKLKHIPYTVSGAGLIARQYGKELSEGTIGQVESTPSPEHDGYVVAIETAGGNLKVIDYHVDPSLDITRDFSSSGYGGAIQDVDISTLDADFHGVATAEVTNSGLLVLRTFEVPAAGGVTATDTFSTFVSAQSVTVDTVPVLFGLDEIIVTSSISAVDQTLRLDTWQVDASGQISWVETISAGSVSAHDATSTQFGHDLVSVMRDSGDDFRMIGWSIELDGSISRVATRGLSGVTDTAIVAPLGSGQNHLVAARTDTQGDLHLFSYGSAFSSAY